MRRRDRGVGGTGSALLLWAVLTVIFTGCGTFSSGFLKSDGALTAGLQTPDARVSVPVEEPATIVTTSAELLTPAVEQDTNFGPRPDPEPAVVSELTGDDAAEPVLVAGSLESLARGSALAQGAQDSLDAMDEEYDPWEPFNEKMFSFNRNLDRFVLKPAARAYMVVMPEPWQVLISNGFDNINFVPRFINSLLQGKWGGAGRELGRFLINSTAGIGGLFDPARDFWGIAKSREDFGQTLGTWGSGPGPYLILPFMEPLTVRDGIGKAVDGLMDPLSYLLPLIWTRAGMKAGETLNDRALNYDLFQGFEESVIDMYSAVRHGYLQRRQQLIKE